MNEIKKEKYYKIFGIATLSIMFIVMCLYAAKQSFWLDELDWTIEFLAKSNIGDMLNQLLKTGYNLPLYYLIMFPIYKIVPYGELWLLFPNIIAAICGIYMTKKIGEKVGGKNLGFLSLCIAATSYVLIYKGVFELRPYAFLFCFSSIALYRYICRMENNNTKNNVLYTISIILLAYIHWFGCLLIAFYFLVDVFLWIRKKISISFIFPYVIVGIVFLPWFILMLTTHTTNFNEYWAGTPSISSLIFTFAFLLGYNIVCCILFAIAFISLIYLLIKKKKINRNIYW